MAENNNNNNNVEDEVEIIVTYRELETTRGELSAAEGQIRTYNDLIQELAQRRQNLRTHEETLLNSLRTLAANIHTHPPEIQNLIRETVPQEFLTPIEQSDDSNDSIHTTASGEQRRIMHQRNIGYDDPPKSKDAVGLIHEFDSSTEET